MHSVQVSKANGPLEIEGRIPEPTAKQVRIRVQACGICHSDSIMKQGLFPGVTYPWYQVEVAGAMYCVLFT